jgi:hypothetical protein
MKKLDRLGWAEGIGVQTFGVSAGVRVSAAGMLPQSFSDAAILRSVGRTRAAARAPGIIESRAAG